VSRFDGARLTCVTFVVVAVCAVAACDPGVSAGNAEGDGQADAVSSGQLPANAPSLFGFGSPASAARVALWDIDVRPDGEGLPSGTGTAAAGKQVYEMYCIACHGPTGNEGPNDRLVGMEPWGDWPGTRGIGNYWPYATTLFDYIRKAMPQNAPGSLTADQTYAVIAYILSLNGLLSADAVLDATTLPAVEMPMRDRFVPDDRVGGPSIR
jgi:S-disulfanyl-L-cysteine oxidoreductase SoxD